MHRGSQSCTEGASRNPRHKITFAKIPGKINCSLSSVCLCACSVVLCVTDAGTPGLFGIAGMYNEATMFHSYNVRRLQGFKEFKEFKMFTCGELPARCRRGFARLKGLKCSKSSCHAERSRSGGVIVERFVEATRVLVPGFMLQSAIA